MRRWNRQVVFALALCLGAFGVSGPASATTLGDPTSKSTNYSVVESEIGGSGCANKAPSACGASSSYTLDPSTDDGGSSLGESAVGNSSSASYQTGSGFNTTAQPGLTMVVNTSAVNLGVLTTGTASTATATFDVTDYTSYGYAVAIIGTPPTMGAHALTALTTDTASNAVVEQFGLNAVKNTSPVSLGDDPLQVPDNVYTGSKFSYGRAGTGTGTAYAQTGKYRFVSNDANPVASSATSSGDTRYTLSFLANAAPTTPGGRYTGNLSIVVTGTY